MINSPELARVSQQIENIQNSTEDLNATQVVNRDLNLALLQYYRVGLDGAYRVLNHSDKHAHDLITQLSFEADQILSTNLNHQFNIKHVDKSIEDSTSTFLNPLIKILKGQLTLEGITRTIYLHAEVMSVPDQIASEIHTTLSKLENALVLLFVSLELLFAGHYDQVESAFNKCTFFNDIEACNSNCIDLFRRLYRIIIG